MNGPHMATGRFEVGDPTLSSETSNNFDISFNFDNGEYFAMQASLLMMLIITLH